MSDLETVTEGLELMGHSSPPWEIRNYSSTSGVIKSLWLEQDGNVQNDNNNTASFLTLFL